MTRSVHVLGAACCLLAGWFAASLVHPELDPLPTRLFAGDRPALVLQEVKSDVNFKNVDFMAKVVGVADGDTVKVRKVWKFVRGLPMPEGPEIRVRLWGIDAPEGGQPFGVAAKKRLATLILGKVVAVDRIEVDRYGRLVATVGIEFSELYPSAYRSARAEMTTIDVGSEMVRSGHAWWYTKYAPNDKKLELAEEEARKAKRGVWSQPGAVAPWEWRSAARNSLITSCDQMRPHSTLSGRCLFTDRRGAMEQA